ncbi:hypothetical protein CesoFtcFv8_005396 [Champsocephalus esox]|uniref:Uncharacterized protein n=1 Tax=Champsocephalus esox TaxID=159716 RepID=A0AAN8CPK3_9TELE|nr:hypothetical protein CesoFtcFv8_005396 [Champsocephalus esox]
MTGVGFQGFHLLSEGHLWTQAESVVRLHHPIRGGRGDTAILQEKRQGTICPSQHPPVKLLHCLTWCSSGVYISSKPNTALPPTSLTNCLQDIRSWMSRNLLKLNGSKTEALLVGTKTTLPKTSSSPASNLIIDGYSIPF